ncbi:MAG: TetR family transcriptional regulator C-terminal domain-containing protein [Nocardioidaceae bacterium]|nr:TetR family transcriptional regulator C-terminal domain-containing protein [Nocardioidaceae bacterium]
MEETTATPPAEAQDSRRTQMLTAAAELIAERGLARTRIADVAERVGASPALVVYYFDTKENLLIAALRESETGFYAAAESLLRSQVSLRERIETLVRLTFTEESQGEVQGQWGLWFDLWNEAFRHPQVAADRRALDEQWRGLIARIVRAGIEAGDVDPGLDVDTFSVTWAALLDGLSVQVALGDPTVTAELATTISLGFAHRELGLA